MEKSKVYPLRGAIQNYAWGGYTFIPELLNLQNADNQPFAEVWLGAHQRGPAQLQTNGIATPLDEWIEQNSWALGEQVIEKFGERLPYLFKVLDVNKMLSIQSHPTKKAAEIGFARENKDGIPLTARHRNYKDDNHKPEVMVAMTDFWLLHGFKTEERIAEILATVNELSTIREYFTSLQDSTVENKIFQLYKFLMEMPQTEVDTILKPLGSRLSESFSQNNLLKESPDYWAALAFRDNELEGGHVDRGIFSIYIYNLVHLKKGEGIFQDAGVPHAYLEGVNIELMANSDNVFRGGLTVKHVDVKELLKNMVFEPVIPNVLYGEEITKGVKIYPTPAPDFELTRIALTENQLYACQNATTPETIIIMEGEVIVKGEASEFLLKRGEAFFATAGASYVMESKGETICFKAAVP